MAWWRPDGGGNAAHQGKALEGEGPSHREGALSIDLPDHPCDPTGARADRRTDAGPASYPGEVLRGERPKRFFPRFLIGEKSGPAERPRLGRWFLPEKSEEDNPSDPADAVPPPSLREAFWPGGDLTAAGTPHTRVRPWKERCCLTEKGARSIDLPDHPLDLPDHPCDPTRPRADLGLNR